jgi:hypothetical protein
LAGERLTATFTEESKLTLSTADIPTKTENAPIVGESSIHTLDDLSAGGLTKSPSCWPGSRWKNIFGTTPAATSPGSSRNCWALPNAGSVNAHP